VSHLRLIYASRPVDHSPSLQNDILATAQRCNARDDITGALIAREDLFLQQLEGPPLLVDQAYARIRQDPRHEGVRLLVRRHTGWRLFPGCSMRVAPGPDWMWTPEQVAVGFPAKAPRPEIEAVFVRLWREGLSTPIRGFRFGRRMRT